MIKINTVNERQMEIVSPIRYDPSKASHLRVLQRGMNIPNLTMRKHQTNRFPMEYIVLKWSFTIPFSCLNVVFGAPAAVMGARR